MKVKSEINFFNRKQISDFFGGNLGMSKIDYLMDAGYLPYTIINQTGLRIVSRKNLELFAQRLETMPITINNFKTITRKL